MSSHISDFSILMEKVPRSRLFFITVRDASKKLNINKFRKWLDKFTDHYMVVNSPVGGVHFHVLASTIKPLPYLKGNVHLHIQPLQKERDYVAPPMFQTDSYVDHPIIPGSVGRFLMAVNESIRLLFNQPRTGLPQRLKARINANRARGQKSKDVSGCVNYLIKNYNENPNPIYYTNMYIKA